MAQRLARFLYRKRNRRIAAGALFGGLLLKNSLKHVFPDDLFFPFYACPASSAHIMDAVKLLNQCKTDMGLTQEVLPVTPFVSATTEVCSAGFSAFNFGQSHIGIPRSFFCGTVEEISHHDIIWGKGRRFNTSKGFAFEKVDENEVMLMQSFLISNDAKRFAIARHLSYIKRNWSIFQAFVSPAFVIVGYILAFHAPKLLFSSTNKPVSILTIVGLSLIGIFVSYILCKLTTAALGRKITLQVDTDAANISCRYAQGGIEMYDKLCETHQALRVLLGRKGERMYTEEGDLLRAFGGLFDPNPASITKRKEYLNGILQSYASQDTDAPR